MTDISRKDKEIAELRQRLREAEDTLQAITGGEVDALVVHTEGGEQVFTLDGADAVYRNAVENINEGILSLSPEGVILYSNHYFAKMVKAGLNTIIGASIFDFIDPQCKSLAESLLTVESGRDEITLQSSDKKSRIPSYIAVNKLRLEKSILISVVITDLTLQKHSEEMMASGRLIQGINSIFYEYLVKGTREELGISCLKIVEELTQSGMGFIAEVPPDGPAKGGVESPGWAVYALRNDSGYHPPFNLVNMGVYTRTLAEGRSLIVNNLKEPPANGTPAGHPAIRSFLGAPLKHQDKIFGVLGLADREGGYGSHELHTAEALGPAIVEVLLRKKAEDALRKSEEQLRIYMRATSEVLYRMSPDWSEMNQLHSHGFLANKDKPSRTWIQEYIPPEDQPKVNAAINKAIKTKSVFELEHRVYRVDGDTGWTFSRAVPLLDAKGEIVEWFGTAGDITKRKKAEEELLRHRDHLEQLVSDRTRDLRSLAHRLVDAQEKERSLIGSSLHDEIGQLLTYTTLLIDKAIRKPDVKMLEEAKITVQDAISKIRDLSSMLSPGVLRSAGLVQAISSMVNDFTRRTKVKVDFKSNENLIQIPEEVALACYRIIQESLTNTVRHAQATNVKVLVSHNKEDIRLEISDDGVGFEPFKMKRATGLTGMRERAVALGGDLNIESNPGKGTYITAILPLFERKQEC